MRQMVAVPNAQGFIAGVLEKEFQRQGFDVTVAEDHVGAVLVAGVNPFRDLWVIQILLGCAAIKIAVS
jgi:hypothetical protein